MKSTEQQQKMEVTSLQEVNKVLEQKVDFLTRKQQDVVSAERHKKTIAKLQENLRVQWDDAEKVRQQRDTRKNQYTELEKKFALSEERSREKDTELQASRTELTQTKTTLQRLVLENAILKRRPKLLECTDHVVKIADLRDAPKKRDEEQSSQAARVAELEQALEQRDEERASQPAQVAELEQALEQRDEEWAYQAARIAELEQALKRQDAVVKDVKIVVCKYWFGNRDALKTQDAIAIDFMKVVRKHSCTLLGIGASPLTPDLHGTEEDECTY